jgi:hypothetical protein
LGKLVFLVDGQEFLEEAKGAREILALIVKGGATATTLEVPTVLQPMNSKPLYPMRYPRVFCQCRMFNTILTWCWVLAFLTFPTVTLAQRKIRFYKDK